jgi:hypothetical protein
MATFKGRVDLALIPDHCLNRARFVQELRMDGYTVRGPDSEVWIPGISAKGGQSTTMIFNQMLYRSSAPFSHDPFNNNNEEIRATFTKSFTRTF